MDNQDWLRIQMSKASKEENRRMREVCRIRTTKDPWSTSRYGKENGAKGGRPQHQSYRDYFLNRTEDTK